MSASGSAVRRSPRNKIARVLMEGYDWTPDQIRFNLRTADMALDALEDAGYVVIPDEPDHYVNFDQAGWFIVHSVACRVAGTLGTCEYNGAIRKIAEDFDPDEDPDQLGLWRITEIDSEGLPSLERAGLSNMKGER